MGKGLKGKNKRKGKKERKQEESICIKAPSTESGLYSSSKQYFPRRLRRPRSCFHQNSGASDPFQKVQVCYLTRQDFGPGSLEPQISSHPEGSHADALTPVALGSKQLL